MICRLFIEHPSQHIRPAPAWFPHSRRKPYVDIVQYKAVLGRCQFV